MSGALGDAGQQADESMHPDLIILSTDAHHTLLAAGTRESPETAAGEGASGKISASAMRAWRDELLEGIANIRTAFPEAAVAWHTLPSHHLPILGSHNNSNGHGGGGGGDGLLVDQNTSHLAHTKQGPKLRKSYQLFMRSVTCYQ